MILFSAAGVRTRLPIQMILLKVDRTMINRELLIPIILRMVHRLRGNTQIIPRKVHHQLEVQIVLIAITGTRVLLMVLNRIRSTTGELNSIKVMLKKF